MRWPLPVSGTTRGLIMGRKLPDPTPCDTMPRYSAPVHGTMHAYSRYRCRCTAAIRARNDWRAAWSQTEAGKLSKKRSNQRQWTSRRDENGLTLREREAASRGIEARRLAEMGWTVKAVARRLGVHERTVQRYLNEVPS